MDRKFFSIIIPVYNSEKFLEYCIQSILAQSFESYEIILIDDGSTDNSGDICDYYKKEFPNNFIVIHQKNSGQLYARQAGLRIASGEYVFFVDSDDALAEDSLKYLNTVICENNADMCILNWRYMKQDNSLRKDDIKGLFEEGVISKDKLFKKVVQTDNLNPLWLKVCKRSLFDLNKKAEDFSFIRHGEDLLQSLPAMAKAEKIYYTSRVIYHYRINDNSVVHTVDPERYKTLFVVRPELYKYLSKLGLDYGEYITSFYEFYLLNIWKNLFLLLKNGWKYSKIKEVFEIILANEWVNKAKNYIKETNLPQYKRISLKLFFGGKFKLLFITLKAESFYFYIKDGIYNLLFK